MKFRLLFAAATLALASSAMAQTSYPLTQIWKVDGGTGSYFPTSGDTSRGFGFNPVTNHLIVSNRTTLNIMDAATGADLAASLSTEGYSGGTFLTNKLGVADDGVIYVCNFANGTAATASNFKVYRHENEGAVGTVAYAELINVRMGDDISVTGSGANTKILVTGSGNTSLFLLTTADGVNFTKNVVTPAAPSIGGTPAIAWDANGVDYWFRNTGAGGAIKYNGATHQGATWPSTEVVRIGQGDAAYGPIGHGQIGDLPLLAVGIGASAATNQGKLAPVFDTATSTTLFYAVGTEFTGGANANGNGSGDVIIDEVNRRLFFLYTNNAISAYQLPAARVREWSVY